MNPFALLREDVHAKACWLYGTATPRNLLKAWLTDGTSAMILYRLMQACRPRLLAPFAMIFNKLNAFFGRCIIGRGAVFGPRFVLIHSYGVVINSAVRGGSDIRLEHLVTIGADKGQAPILGNDIFIGAGAKLIGNIRIGNHVKIGANAVVVDDIPDNATAVGIPARVVDRGTGGECSVFSIQCSDQKGNRADETPD